MYKNGLTLIELLAVLAIIGLLSGAIAVSMQDSRERTLDASRTKSVTQIGNAIQLSRDQSTEIYDTYPNTAAARVGLQEYYIGDWDSIVFVNNSGGTDNRFYCVYTILSNGTYFTASNAGTGYRVDVPLITDCAPQE